MPVVEVLSGMEWAWGGFRVIPATLLHIRITTFHVFPHTVAFLFISTTVIYTINTVIPFVFSLFLVKCSDLMCQSKASLFHIYSLGTGNIHFSSFVKNGCQLVKI